MALRHRRCHQQLHARGAGGVAQRRPRARRTRAAQWRAALVTGTPDDTRPAPLPPDDAAALEADTRLRGFLVAGAEAILTSNIDPAHGVANGTRVLLHSRIMPDWPLPPDQAFELASRLAAAGLGDTVTLPTPPAFVAAAWLAAVIPVGLAGVNAREDAINFPTPAGLVSLVPQHHALTMTLACTFRKVQGLTVSRIIPDLTHHGCPPYITFAMFFVAISRVRDADHMRIIGLPAGATLAHLHKLTPPPFPAPWLAGFTAPAVAVSVAAPVVAAVVAAVVRRPRR